MTKKLEELFNLPETEQESILRSALKLKDKLRVLQKTAYEYCERRENLKGTIH